MGFLVDEVAFERVYLLLYRFPLSVIVPPILCVHPSERVRNKTVETARHALSPSFRHLCPGIWLNQVQVSLKEIVEKSSCRAVL